MLLYTDTHSVAFPPPFTLLTSLAFFTRVTAHWLSHSHPCTTMALVFIIHPRALLHLHMNWASYLIPFSQRSVLVLVVCLYLLGRLLPHEDYTCLQASSVIMRLAGEVVP